ncbi:MAG: MFS transporter, partial [Casimicrobiaceae bacterium]
LAVAPSFSIVLLAAALVGAGSSVFHPESSRVARMASGGQHGLAQSLFQLGGNAGSAIGPLLAASLIAPFGQRSLLWLSPVALLGIVVLLQVSRWYSRHHRSAPARKAPPGASLPRKTVRRTLGVLLILTFSKYFYLASIGSFFTFFLIDKFGLSVQRAQLHLFLFLLAVALGSLVGGPVGDRIGRKPVIWASILGVAPFTLALPYANLFWTGVLSVLIGVILSSAFSAILVYAQELVREKIGLVSGMFFGFAFGMGGLAAAVLGLLADHTSVDLVYRVCAFLPLIGVIAVFLPDIEAHGMKRRAR